MMKMKMKMMTIATQIIENKSRTVFLFMDNARHRLRVNHVFGAGEGHNLRVLEFLLVETNPSENMFFLRILLF